MKPERIQLSRKKGWRLPENTVVVSRPSKWGNPFKIGGHFRIGDTNPNHPLQFIWMQSYEPDDRFVLIQDQAQAVEMFRRLCQIRKADYAELRGKNLACWCKIGTPCHADVLLAIANA